MFQVSGWLAALALVLVWLAGPVGAQPGQPVIELQAGGHPVRAEVAATAETRERGLSGRPGLADDRGMLFVFEGAFRICMWMRDTGFPLSVAFLDEQGVIINIEEMQPGTTAPHCAARPARYALEMNRGWFGRPGLLPGARITGLGRDGPLP